MLGRGRVCRRGREALYNGNNVSAIDSAYEE